VRGLGAGCGFGKGNGRSLGPSGCLFVLGWVCETGERASLAGHAVPPSIEAAVRLAGVHASLGDVCALLVGGAGVGTGVALVVGSGGSLGPPWRPITLGLASEAGEDVPLAIELAVGLVVVVGLSDGEGEGWIGRAVVVSQGAAFADPLRTGSMITSSGTGLSGAGVVGLLGTRFANAMRTGSIVTSLGTGLMGVGVVELVGATGLRPRASSTSVAQSNHVDSCRNVVRAVGDGAGSRISSWVIPVSTSRRTGSCSFVLSCFPTPFASSSLPTAGSWLSCCSAAVMGLLGSVAVAVVLVVVTTSGSNWIGETAGGAMTWCAFATRSSPSGVVVVS
jgi:hypothetical protein